MAGGGFVGESGKRADLYQGGVTAYFIISCIVASMGGSLFGYDLGVSGNLTTYTKDYANRMIYPSIYLYSIVFLGYGVF